MVNLENNLDFFNMKYGVREPGYDKTLLFNKKYVKEINYGAGCHDCNPVGNVKYSTNLYKMYHYKCIHPDLIVQKAQLTTKRLSATNIENSWGLQCLKSEKELRENFEELRKKSILVPNRK
jgi:hypothetical protein